MGGMIVGSFIGGTIPYFWTLNPFSFSNVICTAVGGFLGIYLGYTFAKMTGLE